jgi:membrane dipeptidase
MMPSGTIPLAKEIDRVPSLTVPLDHAQEQRFQRLMEPLIMVDVHVHPMILPEDMEQLTAYLRANDYRWGYQAVKHGGWTAVATANFYRGLVNTPDLSLVAFEDVLQEVGLMLSDLRQQADVMQIKSANDIEVAKQQGAIGFLPTLEHLAIGQELNRLDILYHMGIRLAGLTYTRKNYIGDGQYECHDGGLSNFGIAVVRRMNDLAWIPTIP